MKQESLIRSVVAHCLCSLFFILSCPAFSAPAKTEASKVQVDASAASAITKSEVEIGLLREQIKITKEYQGALLDTVYWALTGVFGLAILLAGFGWWSNFKLYENDKARLEEKLQSRTQELESKLAVMLETNRKEIERLFEDRNDVHLNRLLKEVSDVRAEIALDRTNLGAQILDFRKKIESTEKTSKDINKLIAAENAALRRVEEYVWELKKIPSNILITQSQGIRAAQKAGDSFGIAHGLARMKAAIKENYIDTNRKCAKGPIDSVTRNIDLVAATHGVDVAELKTLLGKIAADE